MKKGDGYIGRKGCIEGGVEGGDGEELRR